MVNKAAMDAAGLSRATRDPDGDRLIRDVAARPAGCSSIRPSSWWTASGSLETLKAEFAKGPIKDYKNRHLAVQAIKIVADGALGSRGAALIAPYTDEPAHAGLLTTPPDQVYAKCRSRAICASAWNTRRSWTRPTSRASRP